MRIAQFLKVSKEEFTKGCIKCLNVDETTASGWYDYIKVPLRGTQGSAGYDFFAPMDIELAPNATVTIPTGIRVKIEQGWVLQIYPRSSMGFKYRMQLNNTVGIIDSDYFYSDNEGHIFCKITNATNEDKTLRIEKGKGFVQGLFVMYGITVDDEVSAVRNGGFGSTDSAK